MLRGDLSTSGSEASARYFGDNQCRSIWQRQSIVAFTAVTIAAGVAFFTPELFDDWRFSAGLLMIVVITAISLGLPWHRIPEFAVIAVPVLDAIAIGLLQSGSIPSSLSCGCSPWPGWALTSPQPH